MIEWFQSIDFFHSKAIIPKKKDRCQRQRLSTSSLLCKIKFVRIQNQVGGKVAISVQTQIQFEWLWCGQSNSQKFKLRITNEWQLIGNDICHIQRIAEWLTSKHKRGNTFHFEWIGWLERLREIAKGKASISTSVGSAGANKTASWSQRKSANIQLNRNWPDWLEGYPHASRQADPVVTMIDGVI